MINTDLLRAADKYNVALGSSLVQHFRNDTFDRDKTNKICHAPLYFFTQCICGLKLQNPQLSAALCESKLCLSRKLADSVT